MKRKERSKRDAQKETQREAETEAQEKAERERKWQKNSEEIEMVGWTAGETSKQIQRRRKRRKIGAS